MEALRQTDESAKKTSKPSRASTVARPFPKKRPVVVAAVEKGQEYGPSNKKKPFL